MYNDDRSSEINVQLKEPQDNQASDSEPDELDFDSGERLTRQESLELREEIRKHVLAYLEEQGSEGRITVADVRAVFGKERCKEGFARERLNELVEEGLLESQQVQGLKVYSLKKFQVKPITSDANLTATLTPWIKGSKAIAISDGKLFAIDEIDRKLRKYKSKIDSLQQKIAHLEETKRIFLEEDDD